MTVPKLRTVNRGGARYYLHPDTNEKAVGVTSVLNMLPKEFLKFWAAKVVAEEAFDRFGVLSSYVIDQDREGAVKWLKTAHQRNTGAAAMKGTEIHEMVEAIIDQGGIPRGMPKANVPYARGFLEFMQQTEAEVIEQEVSVWSSQGYSGTFDLSLRIPESAFAEVGVPSWYEGADVPIIGDIKTTRSGVHAEVAMQLAAYANAEERLLIGSQGDTVIEPNPSYQQVGLVVHLRPDAWRLVPVNIGQDVFDTFLSLLPVFTWEKSLKDDVVLPDLTGSVFDYQEDIVPLEKLLEVVGDE
jgi:hypothetical protein